MGEDKKVVVMPEPEKEQETGILKNGDQIIGYRGKQDYDFSGIEATGVKALEKAMFTLAANSKAAISVPVKMVSFINEVDEQDYEGIAKALEARRRQIAPSTFDKVCGWASSHKWLLLGTAAAAGAAAAAAAIANAIDIIANRITKQSTCGPAIVVSS